MLLQHLPVRLNSVIPCLKSMSTQNPLVAVTHPSLLARSQQRHLTLDNEVSSRLEAGTSNPRKCARQDSPKEGEPRSKAKYSDARDSYPEQSKPIYIRLKTLHKRIHIHLCVHAWVDANTAHKSKRWIQ